MTASSRLQEVRRWLLSAREDLQFAESVAAGRDGQPRHACFLAQQAVEKLLKAALIFANVPARRVHDLDELRDLLPAGWSVKTSHASFGRLIEYAVAVRYPDSPLVVSEADARLAAREARDVRNVTTADLFRRGFEVVVSS